MSAPAGQHRDGQPDLEILAAWVDGRLGPGDRADLVAHLADCAACRTIVAELGRAAERPSPRSWARGLPIAASIAVATIGIGAYLIVQNREQAAPASAPIARPAQPAPRSPSPAIGTTTPSAPNVAAPSPSPMTPPRDRTRAAGTTSVHGKTFRLVAGEWIDTQYRESDFLPVVEVTSRADLESRPALRPFASLGHHFIVVIGGAVYRISIP